MPICYCSCHKALQREMSKATAQPSQLGAASPFPVCCYLCHGALSREQARSHSQLNQDHQTPLAEGQRQTNQAIQSPLKASDKQEILITSQPSNQPSINDFLHDLLNTEKLTQEGQQEDIQDRSLSSSQRQVTNHSASMTLAEFLRADPSRICQLPMAHGETQRAPFPSS